MEKGKQKMGKCQPGPSGHLCSEADWRGGGVSTPSNSTQRVNESMGLPQEPPVPRNRGHRRVYTDPSGPPGLRQSLHCFHDGKWKTNVLRKLSQIFQNNTNHKICQLNPFAGFEELSSAQWFLIFITLIQLFAILIFDPLFVLMLSKPPRAI